MFAFKKTLIRALLLCFVLGTAADFATSHYADARVGGGRSSGRTSGGYGRRSSPPPSRYSSPPSRYDSGNYNNNRGSGGGSFMRGLAGGLAGGLIGSMLFGRSGYAAGYGGGGGGLGLLEILLLAGLAYFGFRWWKNRQGIAPQPYVGKDPFATQPTEQLNHAPFGSYASTAAPLEAEEASDLFFKIQGAWTRRDLSSVRDRIGTEMADILGRDLSELKNAHRINRLENITVRRTDVTDNWQEDGVDYARVRFAANLLDYTVDESSQKVVEGSDSDPVKFEEDWTFAKNPATAQWQLVGIEQV